MARKGWDALSPGYRSRLEKNGIDQTAYDAGESLKKGRGHEKTPERPKGYDRKEYRDYDRRRRKLERDFLKKKHELFADRPKYHEKEARQYLTEYPPSLRLLQWAIEASEEELLDAIRENSETFAFIGYH